MIRLTVREAAEKRGIKTPAELAAAMGHKSRTIAGRLWNGEEVRLLSLDQAAEALGCELGELVTRVPNGRTKPAPREKRAEKQRSRKAKAKRRT
jgi:DNA-binding Xre family transcriptional regulator